MSNLPAIAGTYYDLRQVKSRGCWQVVIDVPAEAAEKLVETFGLPRQNEPTWLAVARLTVPPGARNGTAVRSSADADHPPPPERSAAPQAETKGGWYGLKPSARAALLCKEPEFWVWVNRDPDMIMGIASEAEADEWLKAECGTPKKAWLNPEHPDHRAGALKKFIAIERSYRVSRGFETEEVGR